MDAGLADEIENFLQGPHTRPMACKSWQPLSLRPATIAVENDGYVSRGRGVIHSFGKSFLKHFHVKEWKAERVLALACPAQIVRLMPFITKNDSHKANNGFSCPQNLLCETFYYVIDNHMILFVDDKINLKPINGFGRKTHGLCGLAGLDPGVCT
jgi:hypothetical protein